MARIAIVTNAHIAINPRVWREAGALTAHGHQVRVIGLWTSEAEADVDRALARDGGWRLIVAADLRHSGGLRLEPIAYRVQRRVAVRALRAGMTTIQGLVYAPQALLRAALVEPSDLYIAHLEAGLWVGDVLASQHGKRVSVDVEDWYSENLDPSMARAKDYLQALEGAVLRRAAYISTPSFSMASALAERFGYAAPSPLVIYNGDPLRFLPEPVPAPTGPLRLIWFSQTIGADRGIADALRALTAVGPSHAWQLDIIGRSSDAARREVLSDLPEALRARVRFLDPVSAQELPRVVSGYDVGLALEQTVLISRDVTITNKILRYVQSGLMVWASATSGQREVLEAHPSFGQTYVPGDVPALTQIALQSLHDLPRIRRERERRAALANAAYSYDAQAPKLLEAVERATTAAQ